MVCLRASRIIGRMHNPRQIEIVEVAVAVDEEEEEVVVAVDDAHRMQVEGRQAKKLDDQVEREGRDHS